MDFYFIVLCITVLIIVHCCGAITEGESTNFPLERTCSVDELDALCLYSDSRYESERDNQRSLCTQFVKDLFSFQSNQTRSRVKFADVTDVFSATKPNINVSSWSFQVTLRARSYGEDDRQARKQQYKSFHAMINKKTQFIKRLFSEMSGVRENVTHVAVMFLDGSSVSFEEIKCISEIMESQDTNIKILVTVSYSEIKEMIFFNDTLLIDEDSFLNSKHVITLTICNQCMPGWFVFEHTDSANVISCYQLMTSKRRTSWSDVLTKCTNKGAYLAAIETKHELIFLRERLISYFTNLSFGFENNYNLSYQVYIGLHRGIVSRYKQFYWQTYYQSLDRPMVVNNWMRGTPPGDRSSVCGLWEFFYLSHSQNGNVSKNNEDRFVDEWIDFLCSDNAASMCLCEMVGPRRSEDAYLWRIEAADKELFDQVISKQDLIKFGDNIVSVSANIVNTNFLQFLKDQGKEFPLFDCGTDVTGARYISYVYVCDYITHCNNRRDETFCMLEPKTMRIDDREDTLDCKGVYCCDGFCLPLQWVNDGEIDCNICEYSSKSTINDESVVIINHLKRNETCAFYCNDDKCVHFSELNDDTINCIGQEGPIDETLGKLETTNTCNNTLGHIIWAPKCVYVKDRYGALLGCRDMSHLEDCNTFACPEGYFKCPNTYCIPQHYVLDRKVDCPVGEDERRDAIAPCTGNFDCWNSTMCLHPNLVCDDHPDCPHGDDEVDCNVVCVAGFRCVAGTMTVSDYNRSLPVKDVYPIDRRTRYLDLSGLNLSVAVLTSFSVSENVIVMILSNCKIGNSISGFFSSLWRLIELDLSYNLIETLDGDYIDYSPLPDLRYLNLSYNRELIVVKYLQMSALETLDLSHTGLADVDDSFIFSLPKLKHLNLSHTSITGFMVDVFPPNLILQTLDLRGLSLATMGKNAFNDLTISEYLYTDSFELCCPQIRGPNIPYYTCHGPENAISSCFDLIGVNVHRVLLWLVASIAILGNTTVIAYRLTWDRSILRTGYGLFVTNLGISDLIMGAYLFMIAGADYYYRDIYALFDTIWRESIVCSLAGFLATFSSETSTFFIFLITLDRFLVMKFPFRQMELSKRNIIMTSITIWIIGLLLAVTPFILNLEIYSSNAMCLGLPLTVERFKGWEFSFGVFTVLNFFMCLVIVYSQRVVFQAMSGNKFTGSLSRKASWTVEEIIVAKQLSLIALSNFVCWCPVGIMGFVSLSGYAISNDVYAWTTVIVFPINAAVNPFLYTWPALMSRWDKFKRNNKMSQSLSSAQ